MIDLAPGWQVRCPKCNKTRPFSTVGIRLWAASRGKRMLVYCRDCRRFAWAFVERTPADSPETAAP